MLPAGLPGYETFDPSQDSVPSEKGVGACVVLTMPELQLNFRLHDYFMGIFSHYTNRYAMWHANDKFRDVAESGHDLRFSRGRMSGKIILGFGLSQQKGKLHNQW